MRTYILLLIAAIMAIPARAADILPADSTAVARPPRESSEFRPTQLILPASLIAVGTFGVYNGAFRRFDGWVNDGMTSLRGRHHIGADDYLQYIPAAAYLGMGAVGVPSRHRFRERAAAGVTAYLAMGVMVNAVKYTVRERRPDSAERNSFPSGHTATVFTGAELTRIEYGLWPGIGAYTIATGVAFLRLYNGRHWFNDVLAGAGVGILSARIGYWMLPVYRKWFGWQASASSASLVALPAYSPSSRTVSVNLALTF